MAGTAALYPIPRGWFTPEIAMRCILAVVAVLALAPLAKAEDKPNVLFIAIDDLNDWVGPLGGHPKWPAATLRRFAGERTQPAELSLQLEQ